MTKQELVAKFNPANAANLTEQDLLDLRELTDEQLETLAEAFPNQATRRPYLILFDKNTKPDKQLYQLSTFRNLHNVRKFANLKNFIPWSFKSIFFPVKAQPKVKGLPAQTLKGGPKKVVVDLTAEEAASQLRDSIAGQLADKPPVKPAKPNAAPKKETGTKKIVDASAKKATPKNKPVTVDAGKIQDPGATKGTEVKTDPSEQFTNGE